MKKKISVLLALVLALSLALIGCGGEGNNGENASGSVAGTDSGAESGSDSAGAEDEDGPRDGYLDEATGIWHTTLYFNDHMPISYAMPDGWSELTDGLGKGAFDSISADAVLDNTMQEEDMPGLMIWSNDSGISEDGAQAVYDSMNDSGFLGESREVTYGGNTYISNVVPTKYETTYFFYTGKPDGPIVYVYGIVTDTNQTALEEVLSTLTY